MTVPRALLAAALAAGILAPGCGRGGAGDPKSAAPDAGPAPTAGAVRRIPVEARTVEVRDVSYTIRSVGSIQAQEILRVPARVAGVVQDISFHEGSYVTPDRVMARVDPERYHLAAMRAEAAWKQAEAQAREAEAALEKRKTLHEKDPGWVTEEELTNFSAQLDQARAAAEAARAVYDLARKDQRDSEIRAEAPGIINEKKVDTGQYVEAGTTVATIVDMRRLKLVFRVTESESVRLSESSPVTFHLRALPNREFTAKLYHVAEAADPGTRMVECLAWVYSPGRDLRPGFFADVTVQVQERKGSIVVPETSVLPTERGFIAYVLKGEDEVEERHVRTGLYTSEGDVEILEGLQPGDRLIVRGGALLSPGARVAVQATPSK